MAERLLDEHKNGISGVELVPASGGVFEIDIDDRRIFSKQELGRFPDEGEAEDLVRKNL